MRDRSKYDFFTIYVNMMLGYNAIVHWSIVPICIFIIIKEITMEFFTFLTGSYGLGTDDIEYAEKDLLWFINPFSWIDMFWERVFGYDAEDYIIENPDDEENYYKNWD